MPPRAGPTSAPKLRFSGHQTFPFRHGWLTKAAIGVEEDSGLFRREDALVRLGVGKNMVSSIRHWAQATGVVEMNRGKARLSELGAPRVGPICAPPPPPPEAPDPIAADAAYPASAGRDPYLEDPRSLWLLHWRLTGRRAPASTWHLVFTCFPGGTFTRDELIGWLSRRIVGRTVRRVSARSLRRDVDVFLRTYLPPRPHPRRPVEDAFDCPLAELGLLRRLGGGRYAVPRGPRPGLPPDVLGFAVHEFWRKAAFSQTTLTLERLLYDPGSPGAAFRMDDRGLVTALEGLPAEYGLEYDETAGLRQVRRRLIPRPVELLGEPER